MCQGLHWDSVDEPDLRLAISSSSGCGSLYWPVLTVYVGAVGGSLMYA
jgi:hypothetical protein